MEATLLDTLLSALGNALIKQAPGLVAAHPKACLAAFTAYAFLEFLWPRIRVPGNDTPTVLFRTLQAGLSAVLRKKG